MSEAATVPAPYAGLHLPPVEPGHSLPAAYYLDPDIYAAELAAIFGDCWLFAGHSCELREPGDFLTFTLGDESVVVVRDEAGDLRAHHNVCRHRGSRLCAEPRGHTRALVCPYHQWTYGLDGELRAARLMGTDFDKSTLRLLGAAVEEVAGLVFVCFAEQPPSFAATRAALAAQLTPHRLDRARIVHREHYTVAANWKTLVENNRECYHCRGAHPEFLASNFEFGTHGDPRRTDAYDAQLGAAYARWEANGLAPADESFPDGATYRISRLPLKDGYVTESVDGRPVAPPMGQVGADPGSLRIITLPTMWAHANLDYAMTTRLTPQAPDRTDVEVCFLVDQDATDDQIDLAGLVEVWTATSEQDWELCETNYAGIRSRAYRPGPLSTVVEGSVQHFLDWYVGGLDKLDQRGGATDEQRGGTDEFDCAPGS